jgi:hypothetical protein
VPTSSESQSAAQRVLRTWQRASRPHGRADDLEGHVWADADLGVQRLDQFGGDGAWVGDTTEFLGDLVLSRDEHDPLGLVVAQRVEEVFVREGLIWELRLGGQVIRTTAEHPFYHDTRGWLACHHLQVGDKLLCEDGSFMVLEGIRDTGNWETVFNLRIAEFHTYFVGCAEWGWAVWAHNAACTPEQLSMLELEARTRGLIAEAEVLSPRVVAQLQVVGDVQHAPAYAQWGRAFDAELRVQGHSDSAVAAALQKVGPEPARPALSVAAETWLADRGQQVVYRGHGSPLPDGIEFGSPLTQRRVQFNGEDGLPASVKMADFLTERGYDPHTLTAQLNDAPALWPGTPAELRGLPIGASGIPFSTRLPVAAGYAQTPTGVVYTLLVNQNAGKAVIGRGYGVWEREYVILHQLGRDSIVGQQHGVGLPFIPQAH